jgi:hypothetical protein
VQLDKLPVTVRQSLLHYALIELLQQWGISVAALIADADYHAIAGYYAGLYDLNTALQFAESSALIAQATINPNQINKPLLLLGQSALKNRYFAHENNTDLTSALNTLKNKGYTLYLTANVSSINQELTAISLAANGQGLLDALARLYVAGCGVDWAGFDRHYPRRRCALPTYPFQRQRYWLGPKDIKPRQIEPVAAPTPQQTQTKFLHKRSKHRRKLPSQPRLPARAMPV